MELKEMIKVMQHYEDGGEIEMSTKHTQIWTCANLPCWDWDTSEYRIKESKQKVTIEKWLLKYDDGEYRIVQTSNVDKFLANKVKLLKTYKIEL